jgi:hypothetical protein
MSPDAIDQRPSFSRARSRSDILFVRTLFYMSSHGQARYVEVALMETFQDKDKKAIIRVDGDGNIFKDDQPGHRAASMTAVYR